MSKKYHMEDLGMKALIGRKVLAASINDDHDLVVLDTDKGKLFLTWEGDCCAKCFIANISGVDALVGATIVEAENAEWNKQERDDDSYEYTDTMGTKLKTDKGYVTLESRVEHNGYYGGEIRVSDDEPMDQYSSPRYMPEGYHDFPALKPLADF